MHNVDIELDHVAKVEGHADIRVKVRDGRVESAHYEITEAKRFYPKALEGKPLVTAPQLLARICGTCSNAHILASIEACENCAGITPTEQSLMLRDLTMDGLNVRDHALHLYLFALPDMFDKDNFLELDENDPVQHQILHDAFEIKAAGNYLAEVVAGRSVHAVFPMVGGFLKFPDKAQAAEAVKRLEAARLAVLRTIKLFQDCPFHFDRQTNYLAALPDKKFGFMGGTVRTSRGETFSEEEFRNNLEHDTQEYTTASRYKHRNASYMVGSLARLNLAKDLLHPQTRASIPETLKLFPSTDIFLNNLAQAVEILHCLDEAVDLLKTREIKPEPMIKAAPRAGVGVGLVEAPRGTLYHKVTTNEKGNITAAEVIVPTNQNQANIEEDIAGIVQANLNKMNQDQLVHEIEKLIRAYDPCMSCAAHFLRVKWDVA